MNLPRWSEKFKRIFQGSLNTIRKYLNILGDSVSKESFKSSRTILVDLSRMIKTWFQVSLNCSNESLKNLLKIQNSQMIARQMMNFRDSFKNTDDHEMYQIGAIISQPRNTIRFIYKIWKASILKERSMLAVTYAIRPPLFRITYRYNSQVWMKE